MSNGVYYINSTHVNELKIIESGLTNIIGMQEKIENLSFSRSVVEGRMMWFIRDTQYVRTKNNSPSPCCNGIFLIFLCLWTCLFRTFKWPTYRLRARLWGWWFLVLRASNIVITGRFFFSLNNFQKNYNFLNTLKENFMTLSKWLN